MKQIAFIHLSQPDSHKIESIPKGAASFVPNRGRWTGVADANEKK